MRCSDMFGKCSEIVGDRASIDVKGAVAHAQVGRCLGIYMGRLGDVWAYTYMACDTSEIADRDRAQLQLHSIAKRESNERERNGRRVDEGDEGTAWSVHACALQDGDGCGEEGGQDGREGRAFRADGGADAAALPQRSTCARS